MDDFSLDPFSLAFGLSLGEEIAQEELDRMLSEKMNKSHDQVANFSDKKSQHYPDFKKSNLRPFEKYVQEIIHGKKIPGDKSNCGFDIYDVANITQVIGIKVNLVHDIYAINGDFVSKKFLEVIRQVLSIYPRHNVKEIIFDIDGKPVINDKPVFCTYDAGHERIVFNLSRHFSNAFTLTFKANKNISIRLLLSYSMLSGLLHEIFHSFEENLNPNIPRQDLEKQACEWEKQELCRIAHDINVEPAMLEDEIFFCHKFKTLAQELVHQNYKEWVEYQKMMIDANIMYYDNINQIAILTAKEYYGVIPSNRKKNISISNHFSDESKKMENFCKNEALKKSAVCEAINNGYDIKIRISKQEKWLQVTPLSTYYDGSIYRMYYCKISDNKEYNINILNIQSIVFLPR